ncbi:16S/23S rRNA (cytidine-2'-O)-methyltransferase TlyA [Thalassocella blandensis]|nr:16S/23S rRNA (cytidine-2'-O)-methyltransferase TlyA [Thalassocella blandensis]
MRLDQLLIHKSLARSRTQAQKLIAAGQVMVASAGQWQVVTKVSGQFEENTEVKVNLGEEQRYVSRAGLKLAGALETLALDVKDLICLDVGQSTGGFTDCLLQHQAKKVVGVDVGHTQLANSLRGDARVICMEGINARELPIEEIFDYNEGRLFTFAVMDVSFISQTLILPGLAHCIAKRGKLLSLVKPQFEVGPKGLAKGGIVKDESLFAEVQHQVQQAAESAGFSILDYIPSPIDGGDGNKEFFLYAQKVN